MVFTFITLESSVRIFINPFFFKKIFGSKVHSDIHQVFHIHFWVAVRVTRAFLKIVEKKYHGNFWVEILDKSVKSYQKASKLDRKLIFSFIAWLYVYLHAYIKCVGKFDANLKRFFQKKKRNFKKKLPK